MPTHKVELALLSKEMEILLSNGVQELPSPAFFDWPTVNLFSRMIEIGSSIMFREYRTQTPPIGGQSIWPWGQMIYSYLLVPENISQSLGYCCMKPIIDVGFWVFSDLEDKIKPLFL